MFRFRAESIAVSRTPFRGGIDDKYRAVWIDRDDRIRGVVLLLCSACRETDRGIQFGL